MNNELPIPFTDYIYLKPVKKQKILVNEQSTLYTFGEVLAIGDEVKHTKVGEYVAFELWDKPEFELLNGEVCHFVREKDAVCKLPESWVKVK